MPKIRGSSLTEHRLKTRQKIFQAFAELLQREPYDAITLADIAAEAGIGRTAMYNHFSDKESIVLAFATEETNVYLERLEDALDTVSGPVDSMSVYVRHHLRMSQELHLGLGSALYGMLSPESMVEIRKHVRMVERVVRDILHRGIASDSFVIEDIDATVSLLHATLQVRSPQIDPDLAVAYVLRALGAR